MFLSGIWEFFNGNTFAFTVFCSYASFLVSIWNNEYTNIWGMLSAYEDPAMLSNAIGFFLIG